MFSPVSSGSAPSTRLHSVLEFAPYEEFRRDREIVLAAVRMPVFVDLLEPEVEEIVEKYADPLEPEVEKAVRKFERERNTIPLGALKG